MTNTIKPDKDGPASNPLLCEQFSFTEFVESRKKLKSGKPSGLDYISNDMIMLDSHPHLFLDLFNKLLDIGVFPASWTESIIVPIHTKGLKTDENNYWGIALLSCIGNFF